jgi:RHS repeat-associated protein
MDDDGAVCVFSHDRNGDRVVDAVDTGIFWEFTGFSAEGTPAPEIFRKPATSVYDLDGDTRIDLFDFHGLTDCYLNTNGLCLAVYDQDTDGQVTYGDFETFVASIGGPGLSPWSLGGTASRFGNPFMWTGQRYDSDTGMYHFWGRSYKPTLGRFLQEDMQGIHSWVDVGISSGGNAPFVSAPAVAAQSEYANGFNLFAYLGLNPVNGTDPFGLSWDDDIDDQIADITGQKLYSLGMLNEGAKWASIGLQTAVSIAGSLLPGSGLFEAFGSVKRIINGQGGFWDAVAVAAVAVPAIQGALALKALYKARRYKTGTNCVYRSFDAAGRVQYVGITDDLARRAAEHLSSKGIQIESLMEGLSRSDARAVEQVLIEYYGLGKNGGTLMNKINAISPKNPKYAEALRRGVELLQSIGFYDGA